MLTLHFLFQVRRRLHFVSLAARVFLTHHHGTNRELVTKVIQTKHLQDAHLFAIVKTWGLDMNVKKAPPGDQLILFLS